MGRRLLVVSYYFAPLRAVASIRWTKLAKYLTRDGYTVDVMTSASTGAEDSLLAAELSQLGRIIRIPHADKRFARTGFKANVSGSSPGKPAAAPGGFVKRLKKAIIHSRPFALYEKLLIARKPRLDYERACDFAAQAEQYLVDNGGVSGYDAVICTFGPVGDTLLALRIKELWPETKLIMDFRDPMNSITIAPRWRRRYDRLQRRVCDEADAVVSVSRGCAGLIHKTGQPDSTRVLCNGFDREDIAGISAAPNGKFSFCYTGQIYKGRSDLTPFFRVLGSLIESGDVDSGDIAIHYAGTHFDALRGQAVLFGLADAVVDHGSVDRAESLRLQLSSFMPLMASWSTADSPGVLTGKFFEYMMMNKPIVAMISGDRPGSELRGMIEAGGLGIVREEPTADADDEALRKYLLTQYAAYKNSGQPVFEPTAGYVDSFDYRNLARRWEELICEVCGG